MTALDRAAAALRAGQVVAIPTDTVYGLASLPEHAALLFEIKRRPPEVQVPVLVADAEQALALAEATPLARSLMERFWPGALTVVVPRRGGGGTVGVRCPASEVARELCRRVGPLATTSANLHGEPPLTTAGAVRAAFGAEVPVVVDGGPCEGEPSTVVDATGERPVVLRAGAVPAAALDATGD